MGGGCYCAFEDECVGHSLFWPNEVDKFLQRANLRNSFNKSLGPLDEDPPDGWSIVVGLSLIILPLYFAVAWDIAQQLFHIGFEIIVEIIGLVE